MKRTDMTTDDILRIVVSAIIEQQKHEQLCPQTIDELHMAKEVLE